MNYNLINKNTKACKYEKKDSLYLFISFLHTYVYLNAVSILKNILSIYWYSRMLNSYNRLYYKKANVLDLLTHFSKISTLKHP